MKIKNTNYLYSACERISSINKQDLYIRVTFTDKH